MSLKSRILVISLMMMPTLLLAADPPRTSFMILGGGGGYNYNVQPGPADVFLYSYLTSSIPYTNPLKVMADVEAYSPMEMQGKSATMKLMVEKFFLDSGSLGMTIGLAHTQATESCVKNCGEAGQLLLLQPLLSGGSGSSSLLALSLMPSLFEKPSVGYQYTTFDLGLNYHFAPGAVFDPYLGGNVGAGLCTIQNADAIMCTALKYGGRVGARINFTSNLFMMIQAEADQLQFSISSVNGTGTAVSPVPDKHALIGIGFNI